MKRRMLVMLMTSGAFACAAPSASAQTWENKYADKVLLSSAGSDETKTLTILAPTLSASGTITFPGTDLTFPASNASGVLINGGTGTLNWGAVTIGNGGTNSSAALVNGKLMISSGGAIVEGTSSTTPSFTSITATTAASGITIGTGNNATNLTSAATGSAKTVSFPNATGNLALVASTIGVIANTDVTGLGTMSTQNGSAVAITGGTGAFTSSSTTSALSASNSGVQSTAITGTSVSNTATNATVDATKMGLGIVSTGTWTGAGAGVNDGMTFNVSGGTTNNDIVGTGGTWSINSLGNLTTTGTITASSTGAITAGDATHLGSIVLSDGSSNTATLQAGAIGTNRTYTFQDAGAAANVALITGTVTTNGVIYNTSATAQASTAASTAAGQVLQTTTLGGAPTWAFPFWIITGSTAGSNVAASSYSPSACANIKNATVSLNQGNIMIAPRTGIIKNLRVAVGTAPGSGKTWTFTLVNSSTTTNGPAASVTGTTAPATGSDLSTQLVVNAGDFITMTVSSSGGPTASGAAWTFELQ